MDDKIISVDTRLGPHYRNRYKFLLFPLIIFQWLDRERERERRRERREKIGHAHIQVRHF